MWTVTRRHVAPRAASVRRRRLSTAAWLVVALVAWAGALGLIVAAVDPASRSSGADGFVLIPELDGGADAGTGFVAQTAPTAPPR